MAHNACQCHSRCLQLRIGLKPRAHLALCRSSSGGTPRLMILCARGKALKARQKYRFPAGKTLVRTVADLPFYPGFAVTVNGALVAYAEWPETAFEDSIVFAWHGLPALPPMDFRSGPRLADRAFRG